MNSVGEEKQNQRYSVFCKVGLNMKAPGKKKKYSNTYSPLLRPESFYKLKKLFSLKRVVCLPLSHSSFKVTIRLR